MWTSPKIYIYIYIYIILHNIHKCTRQKNTYNIYIERERERGMHICISYQISWSTRFQSGHRSPVEDPCFDA